MPHEIPSDFDVKAIPLDPNEAVIRLNLPLDIVIWARFRHPIGVGISASSLTSLHGPISDAVKAAYRELGKSHYEVIMSLGYSKIAYLSGMAAPRLIYLQKSLKDLYFHFGCLLDNLARIIYIVNDPKCLNEKRGAVLRRHKLDWGDLLSVIKQRPEAYADYAPIVGTQTIREVTNVRNAITHDWTCPIQARGDVPYWPIAIRSKRQFFWHHDESVEMASHYKEWRPIQDMVEEDMASISELQSLTFALLARDATKFERAHGVAIR